MSTHYSLHVIRAQDVLYKSFFHGKPSLYVVVRFGSTVRRTQHVKNNISPTWDQSLAFPSSNPSEVVKIQLKHRSKGPRDKDIGVAEIELRELIALCENGEAGINVHEKRNQRPSGKVFLRVKSINETEAVSQDLEGSRHAIQGVRGDAVDSTVVAVADGMIRLSEAGDLYDSLEKLCETLDVFVKFIDDVSKIHPYFSAAWQVATSVYKAVSKQFECDQKVVELVRSMEKAFAFARSTQDLKGKTRILESSIVELFKQIKACCEFIQGYVGHSFGGRMLDTGASKKIDEFMQVLARCERDIDSGLLHYNTVIEARTAGSVDTLYLQQRLKPDELISASRATCLEGTRVAIRREIIDWVNSKSEPNILLLHGIAGAGKSTIALTISDYFLDVCQRGALLVFERGKSEAHSVFRTLAFKLALFDSTICSHIVDQVKFDADIASASREMQFQKLILKPLKAAGNVGPVIIILDGLDECGSPESRRELFQLFRQEIPKLPKSFRFLFTSRPVSDILSTFRPLEDSARVIGLDVDSVDSRSDILLYIRSEIHRIIQKEQQSDIPPDWSWDDNISTLSRSAGGLFVWASTAVKLVEKSYNPFQRLQRLISDSRSLHSHGLDQLYDTVFRSSGILWDDDESKTDVLSILILVLWDKGRLSIPDIDAILHLPPYNSSRRVLSSLQSVLTYSSHGPVLFFHASVKDYLLSPDRSRDPWFIMAPSVRARITLSCFQVMKDMLCFNICHLETSYLPNNKVPGLQDRIKEKIPRYLSHACQCWDEHLKYASYSSVLLNELSDFLQNRLLYWLEVMSLLNMVDHAGTALLQASVWFIKWMTACACDMEVSLRTTVLVNEASEFVDTYKEPISTSAPHIYLSALPSLTDFSGSSELSKHYSRQILSPPRIEQPGCRTSLIDFLKSCRKQDSNVCKAYGVSISHCGRLIALESLDGGVVILSQEGESRDTVIFKTVSVIPDAKAGGLSFSGDGKRIVARSVDNNLFKVWDTRSGRAIPHQFECSDSIMSKDLSFDGTRLAFCDCDGTIIVWDVDTGERIGSCLRGHSDWILAIAFSPDGTRIVSGSHDGQIKFWDVQCNAIACESENLEGGYGPVLSLCFAPDGECVVAGYLRGPVVIWDGESGDLVLGPLMKHEDGVKTIAFSNDGLRFVTGCFCGKVIVWDTSSGSMLSGPFQVHNCFIQKVVFLDDTRIMTCGEEGTVRISDMTSDGLCPVQPTEQTGKTSTADRRVFYDWTMSKGDFRREPLIERLAIMEFEEKVDSKKGWVCGPQNELLVWIPSFTWQALWYPRNIVVHGHIPSVKIDFANAAHGEHWTECFNPSP